MGLLGRIAKAATAAATAFSMAKAEPPRQAFDTQGLAYARPQAVQYDPTRYGDQLGYRARPSPMSFLVHDIIYYKVPIVSAIVELRSSQLATFGEPRTSRYDTGFRIVLRDKRQKMTAADREYIHELEQALLQTGFGEDPRGRDDFPTFLRKIAHNLVLYDQIAVELVPGLDGRPSEWYAIDATSIALASTPSLVPSNDVDAIRTVQVLDNIVVAEFTAREMAFGCMHPRTSIRQGGYGTSFVEMAHGLITAYLNALNYNANLFDNGMMSRGVLNIRGNVSEDKFQAFLRMFWQLTTGAQSAGTTPVLNSDAPIDWISMNPNQRDMEFSAFMDHLIKGICSMALVAPDEINYKYGNSGGQKQMFESANKSKLTESKDRGLKPLLRCIARFIDTNIIWALNPRYKFEFIGLESMTPKELADLNTQRVRSVNTIDELRAENGDAPLTADDRPGNTILDGAYMAAQQQKQQMLLQQAQMAAEAAASRVQAGKGTGADKNALQAYLAQNAAAISQTSGRAATNAESFSSPPDSGSGSPEDAAEKSDMSAAQVAAAERWMAAMALEAEQATRRTLAKAQSALVSDAVRAHAAARAPVHLEIAL